MVPLAGIEPALLAELDFESSASTNSATGACRDRPEGERSRSRRNIAGGECRSTRAYRNTRSAGAGHFERLPPNGAQGRGLDVMGAGTGRLHRVIELTKHCPVIAPGSTAAGARARTLSHRRSS